MMSKNSLKLRAYKPASKSLFSLFSGLKIDIKKWCPVRDTKQAAPLKGGAGGLPEAQYDPLPDILCQQVQSSKADPNRGRVCPYCSGTGGVHRKDRCSRCKSVRIPPEALSRSGFHSPTVIKRDGGKISPTPIFDGHVFGL